MSRKSCKPGRRSPRAGGSPLRPFPYLTAPPPVFAAAALHHAREQNRNLSAAKGIELRGVESGYEGDLDLRGFLGISPDVEVGYKKIRVYFKIDADISEEQKEELVRMAGKYSPVYNTVTKSTPVEAGLDKAG